MAHLDEVSRLTRRLAPWFDLQQTAHLDEVKPCRLLERPERVGPCR
jgi:hypothetical protein